jgi:hypothetical protein
VIGIGLAATNDSTSGSSSVDFWRFRCAVRATDLEPKTKTAVLSSIHSSPSGFASKCVAYANRRAVERWDIGGPWKSNAFGR